MSEQQQDDAAPLSATRDADTTPSPYTNAHVMQQPHTEIPASIAPDLAFSSYDEFAWERDPFAGSLGSNYPRYSLPVDHEEGDRAMEIKLCSWKRPHMRALHCAWISFFLAFTIWFAPAPLLKEIQDTLGLTKQQVWTSSITNDITAIVLRILIGPVCDNFGARIPMAVVLVLAAIPTAMVGLVNSAAGLAVIRLFIGIAGSSFVMAQFWPSRMFSREIVGTAVSRTMECECLQTSKLVLTSGCRTVRWNWRKGSGTQPFAHVHLHAIGICAGWGNLGGAFAQVFMGSVLFPVFRDDVYGGNSEKAWRTICVIPAGMALIWGLIVPWISDDAPMGNYSEMQKRGTMDRIFFTTSLRSGAKRNTWILYIQYACCFGVELVMNNASVLYFNNEFGLPTEQAATLGFVFGSMNLFARGIGGWVSDRLNLKYGLRGRLWLQTILLFLEGTMIIVFAFSKTLVGAIVTMSIFSLFTQSTEGAIYGVVPYVSKLYTGSVAGLVGAGGNVGSVIFALGFRSLSYHYAFIMMGTISAASSFLSIWINIPCHAGLLSGEDNNAVIKARERYLRRRDREYLNATVGRFTAREEVDPERVAPNIELREPPTTQAEPTSVAEQDRES